MFAHEHDILLPDALAQKGCKVNHFFIPAKILSKKILDKNSLTPFSFSYQHFRITLISQSGCKSSDYFFNLQIFSKDFYAIKHIMLVFC
jgi:hypothetical protein